MDNGEKISLKWEAFEYHYSEKSADWFWALGIIAISIAVTSILFNNLLFALFILLGAFVLAVYAKRIPLVVNFEINDRGIKAGRAFYKYKDIEGFRIADEENEHPKLLIKSDTITMPLVAIPIHKEDVGYIKNYLDSLIPEEDLHEPLSQKVMEYLGF